MFYDSARNCYFEEFLQIESLTVFVCFTNLVSSECLEDKGEFHLRIGHVGP
jgi:hypothetical protein